MSLGEFDLNCNFLGTLHTLENSMWNGRLALLCIVWSYERISYPFSIVHANAVRSRWYLTGYGYRMWNTARRSLWRYEGNIQVAFPLEFLLKICDYFILVTFQGEYYQLDNLSFLIVRNSGHLLPMDLPGPALQMIHRCACWNYCSDNKVATYVFPCEYVDSLIMLALRIRSCCQSALTWTMLMPFRPQS